LLAGIGGARAGAVRGGNTSSLNLVVFSSSFFLKKLCFHPLFYKIELNTMQIFWQKDDYSLFWILASRG
jgi:hypothetical protein